MDSLRRAHFPGYQQFTRDPLEWWATRLAEEEQPGTSTYEMKKALDVAGPNPGHFALAEMERMGLLKHIITQNVHILHRRAGSVNVAEIHGNRTKLRCMECMVRLPRDEYPRRQAATPLPGMRRCKERGAVLIEINPSETSLTPAADLVLPGPSGEVLPLLVAGIKERP